MAQISYGRYHRDRWGEASRFLPAAGFQVYAERGAAWLEMPDRIQWSDPSGTHEERLPLEPTVGDVLNDQFHGWSAATSRWPRRSTTPWPIARCVSDLQPEPARGEGRRSPAT